MIRVIDASVMVRAFWRPAAAAVEVYDAVLRKPGDFAVPELFLFETYAVMTRILPDGQRAFAEAVLPVLETGVHRIPMSEDLRRAADRYVEMGLSGYDACYAGLAEELGAGWLTFDAKAYALIMKTGIPELLEE